MNSVIRDFVSDEPRKFRFRIGHRIASSLYGFVVGVIVASIIWLAGIWYLSQLSQLSQM